MLGIVIIICGFAYAISCAMSSTVAAKGFVQGRQVAAFCLLLGIVNDLLIKWG